MADIGLYDNFEEDDILDFEEFDSIEEFEESLIVETRYIKPLKSRDLPDHLCRFSNAEKLANSIALQKNERCVCVVNGSFIFGDFIEAFIVNNKLFCDEMIISTLSISENNVDSLRTLVLGGAVKKLDLILSDYFYSHERRNLIPYIYEQLDIDNRLQVAVAGIHTKICLFRSNDMHYVIHGSANLRSSGNIEQFELEENEEVYNFYKDIHSKVIEKYKTINKSIRGEKLWDVIQ